MRVAKALVPTQHRYMKTKKELKNEFKDKKPTMGIFQIRNTVSQKVLVEASTDLSAIWNRQQFQLKNGLHPNVALQTDWSELGESCFVYEILCELKQEEDGTDYKRALKQLEQMFVDDLQPFGEKGYNTAKRF